MNITDSDVRRRLQLGEDSRWEFKQIEFVDDHPNSPSRDDFADEMTAFANTKGGILLCGVSDSGELQGMTPKQVSALSRMLVEVSTDTVKPAIRIHIEKRELDGKMFMLVEVPGGNYVHERSGKAFLRVGDSKRRMESDEYLRLA